MADDHPTDPRRALGALGEDLATAHLIRRGCEIIDRNFRTRWGELDIVASNGRALIFCEVKTRRATAQRRNPLESVHARKQMQLRRMAGQWMAQNRTRLRLPECRFDAIGITVDASGQLLALEHLEGAF